jgi:phage terminase large subunit-like protein
VTDIELSREALEKLPQEELVRLARKFKEHEAVAQATKGDVYWKNTHRKQRRFHAALNRVRVVFGGNRSGKTTAGTNEARWISEGTHPLKTFRLPNKGCIVVQDFQTHAKDIMEPKIREWFPPGLTVDTETNSVGAIVKYKLRNGSTIDVKSHEQDMKVFEGSDYDWVWFDEPPPHAIFKALWRGLTDRRGICWITGTPITEPWLYDLYEKAQADDNGGMYWSIFMSIHENVKNIGEGDEVEGKARIAEFLDAFDDDEREAREHGRFLHMRGRIFKSWNDKTHLITPFAWPNQWPVLISVDPHPRKPWGLAFLGLSPSGAKFLLSSYKVEGVVEIVAAFILEARMEIELERQGAPRIASCWIDNYARVESMIKPTTIIDELNRLVSPAIPRFKPAPKNVDEKITIFKSWLKVRETKYGPRPDFFVFDNAENKAPNGFVYEIKHYVWAGGRGAKRNQLRNVPVKENDDLLDPVMQLCLVLDSKSGQNAEDQPKVHSYLRGHS